MAKKIKVKHVEIETIDKEATKEEGLKSVLGAFFITFLVAMVIICVVTTLQALDKGTVTGEYVMLTTKVILISTTFLYIFIIAPIAYSEARKLYKIEIVHEEV